MMIPHLGNVAALGAILLGTLALEVQIVTNESLPLPALDRAKVQALRLRRPSRPTEYVKSAVRTVLTASVCA